MLDNSHAINSETPMPFDKLITQLTPETYANLKTAVEIGRWPNGDKLTPTQREDAMQLVIAYDHLHYPEQQRVGYINRGEKAEGEHCDDKPETNNIKWR
jgi:uncharacterized protein